MNPIKLHTDELKNSAGSLKAGQRVLLTGTVYTARDAAHKRLVTLLDEGKLLPFDLDGATVYYAGPTEAPEGMVIGSCGPTTSGRMDVYTKRLLDLGLTGMIGKGGRNGEVISAIRDNKAVYFCAIGGAGALYAKHIKKNEVIAFEDLGCESIKRLYIEDFPLIAAIDASGGNLFKN